MASSNIGLTVLHINTFYAGFVAGASVPPLPPSAFKTAPTLPYITVQEIAGINEYTHDGDSGIVPTIVTFNCWHPSYETAAQFRETLRKHFCEMHNFEIISSGANKVKIHGAISMGDTVMFDPERQLQRAITKLKIFYDWKYFL